MNVHNQYNLVFRVIELKSSKKVARCFTISNNSDALSFELSLFISTGFKLIDTLSKEIQDILNGIWVGSATNFDNCYITSTNNYLEIDLNTNIAYLGHPDDNSHIAGIPITDLRAIFNEWISFRDSL